MTGGAHTVQGGQSGTQSPAAPAPVHAIDPEVHRGAHDRTTGAPKYPAEQPYIALEGPPPGPRGARCVCVFTAKGVDGRWLRQHTPPTRRVRRRSIRKRRNGHRGRWGDGEGEPRHSRPPARFRGGGARRANRGAPRGDRRIPLWAAGAEQVSRRAKQTARAAHRGGIHLRFAPKRRGGVGGAGVRERPGGAREVHRLVVRPRH